MATYVWEVDINGYIGALSVTLGPNPQDPAACSGYLQLDTGDREALTKVRLADSILYFTRSQTGQDFNGILHGDQVLGTFTDPSGLHYPWSARPAVTDQGLAELGDWNGDGVTNSRDIVDYLASLGLLFHSYRVCDDEYNPGGFQLLDHPAPGLTITDEDWTWRPDGLVKTIGPESFDKYAVAPAPYPLDRLPNLRYLGKALHSIPKKLLDPLLQGQGWTVDLSGIMGQDGVTSEWLVNVNGYRGRVLIASLQKGRGRICFDSGPWEPLYSATLSGGKISFRRVLSNSVEQVYTGTVSSTGAFPGLSSTMAGTFTQEGQSYMWNATQVSWDSLSGELQYSMNANGFPGRLRLRLQHGWIGRLILAPEPNVDLDPWASPERWERLEKIRYQNKVLDFYRPGADQAFTGTVNGSHIAGSFVAQGESYPWEGQRVFATGGTCLPGSKHKADEDIGTVGHLMFLGTHSTPSECVEEIVGHPLKYWLDQGGAPFTSEDLKAYHAAFFPVPGGPTANGRPIGFVSDYAAQGDEDFANTLVAYATHRPVLWSLAYEDFCGHSSKMLLDKMQFLQQRVFHDAYVGGPWRIDANGHPGMLTVLVVPGSPPTFSGKVIFDDLAVQESIDQIDFNGVTLRFHRREPGGLNQNYIGQLKGYRIEGFFTQAGQSYPWSAISVIQQ